MVPRLEFYYYLIYYEFILDGQLPEKTKKFNN